MTKPLLDAVRLRIDRGGVPEVDGLSFATSGDRVLLLAAPPALFEVAAGVVRPRHGELLVGGVALALALRDGQVAAAPLDPPLPSSWTTSEYLVWSTRLTGCSKADARERAETTLARLKLEAFAGTRLSVLPVPARRALVVGAALATGAEALLLCDPLAGLTLEAGRALARVLIRATDGLRTAIFLPRTSLASPLAIDADEAIVLDGTRVLAQGAPAEIAARDRSYAVRIHGGGPAFARIAEKRGARVAGSGACWTVDLGEHLRANDLLDVATASGTVILELRPLALAFG